MAEAGMPRWVKTMLVIAAVVALVAVVAMLTGIGGEHGPGRHGAAGVVNSGVAVDRR